MKSVLLFFLFTVDKISLFAHQVMSCLRNYRSIKLYWFPGGSIEGSFGSQRMSWLQTMMFIKVTKRNKIRTDFHYINFTFLLKI